MALVVGPILHFGGLAFELMLGPLPSDKVMHLGNTKTNMIEFGHWSLKRML